MQKKALHCVNPRNIEMISVEHCIISTWRRRDMETISAVPVHYEENLIVLATWSFDAYFDVYLYNLLSKQPCGR